MARRAAVRNSTAEWRAIAEGPDLLFHIHSIAGKEGGGWTEEEFYASGREDWEQFLSHWKHFEPTVGGRCVEIGCGAGRLTAPLSAYFDAVDAVDVSSAMIALTKAKVGDNVTFHEVCSNVIPLEDSSVDAVFTVQVLQHLDNLAAIRAYIAEALRVLKPGGTIMAHVMLPGREISLARKLLWEAKLIRSRYGLSRSQTHTSVRMVFPTAGQALHMFRDVGFADVELRGFPVTSTGGFHSFFLGRKRR
ncbi:MAG TPA: methyltransferase domain-containing protein [Mycobacteriales bacterium]|nr:methyltransferase domain-containing protein [Mycobacteriales bacterium]